MFAPIAPLLLLIASGLVFVSWWVLAILMWPLGKLGILFLGRFVVTPSVYPDFLKNREDAQDAKNGVFEEAPSFRWVLFSC